MFNDNYFNQYNSVVNDNKPLSVNDFISNKINIIHNELYNNALEKAIAYEGIDKNKYKFIEIKNNAWNLPSKVLLKERDVPFNSYLVDLSNYWDNNLFINREIDDTINYEITKIDYAKDVVTLKNKVNSYIIDISIDQMREDMILSDDLTNSDIDTFLYGRDG